MIRHLDLYTLLSLNESYLFFFFTISNPCTKWPGKPKISQTLWLDCLPLPCVIFSCWLNEGNSKIWQISKEIFYTISWDSSQIYGCTLRDTMMQKCWEEITLVEYNFHSFTMYFLTQYVLPTEGYKSGNIYRQDCPWCHLYLAGILSQLLRATHISYEWLTVCTDLGFPLLNERSFFDYILLVWFIINNTDLLMS